MSEEEIKKNIDEIIDNYNTFLDDEEFGDYYEREWAEFELKTITAFLDLYNKEKEKNEILKDKIKSKVKEIKDRPIKDEFITATQGKLNAIIDIESLLDKEE